MTREEFLKVMIVRLNQFNDYMRDNHSDVDSMTDLTELDWYEQFEAYLELEPE